MATEFVEVRNANTGGVATVPKRSLRFLAAKGWVETKSEPQPEKKTKSTKTAEVEPTEADAVKEA